MNIQTVAENLRNTIAGKEKLVAHYREIIANQKADCVSGMASIQNHVMAEMLDVNIDELKRILQDVEQCIGVEE